jgi:hypothetical protein
MFYGDSRLSDNSAIIVFISSIFPEFGEEIVRNYDSFGHCSPVLRIIDCASFVFVELAYMGCPTSDVAQRAMREAAPDSHGASKARQL